MLSNIRISPAQAVKEQSDRKLRAIERVLAGEAFTITTDRHQRVYHFALRDDLYYLLCGGLVLGCCDTGTFFPSGFVVMLHILGGSTNATANFFCLAAMPGYISPCHISLPIQSGNFHTK